MKKLFTYLAFIVFWVANAQIPNGDFEEITQWGTATNNWGTHNPNGLSIVIIDSLDVNNNPIPEVVPDTYLFEENTFDFSFPVFEDNLAGHVMKINNAFNLTQNRVEPGKMYLWANGNSFSSTINPLGNNSGMLISQNTIIEGLGFSYKFHSVNNDTAQAKLYLYNANGINIGSTIININEGQPDYTYVSAPLIMSSNETAAFITIEFGITNQISSTSLGSSLTLDNVSVNNLVLANDSFQINSFSLFPTIANNEITIIRNNLLKVENQKLQIINMEGRVIKELILNNSESTNTIDVSQLSSGQYLIKTDDYISKFIKK